MTARAYTATVTAEQADYLAATVAPNAACVQWTVTATVNVIDGIITLDDSALDVEPVNKDILAILTDQATGGLITRIDVGPWGEDEESMDRADKGLAQHGLRRVEPWEGDSGDQFRTALVTR